MRDLVACKRRTFTFTDIDGETSWHVAANYVNWVYCRKYGIGLKRIKQQRR
jgi:hypothetical protein